VGFSATVRRAEQALSLQRRRPYALGPMVLSLRRLLEAGMEDRAAEEAERFALGIGGDERAGEGLLVLVRKGRSRHFVDGECIVEQGQRASDLYVITSGTARVVRDGEVIAHLKWGQSFGEAAVLGGYPRTATVVAEGGASVVGIRRTALYALGSRSMPFKRMLRAVHRNRVLEQLVPSHPVLSLIGSRHRYQLFAHFESRRVQAGAKLVTEGARSVGFFVVGSGDVRVYKADASGHGRDEVARLGPGDFFGEISLLDGVPATATVEAHDRVGYFVLWRESFNELMEDLPDEVVARIKAVGEGRKVELAGIAAGGPPPLPIEGTMICPMCGDEGPLASHCGSCGADVHVERRAGLSALGAFDFTHVEPAG
jgi:CRP-like cAMP-binding protein